jgi:hypothetical protein
VAQVNSLVTPDVSKEPGRGDTLPTHNRRPDITITAHEKHCISVRKGARNLHTYHVPYLVTEVQSS